MSKFCRNCGTLLPDEAEYCLECGTKVINIVNTPVKTADKEEIKIERPVDEKIVINQNTIKETKPFPVMKIVLPIIGLIVIVALVFFIKGIISKNSSSDETNANHASFQYEKASDDSKKKASAEESVSTEEPKEIVNEDDSSGSDVTPVVEEAEDIPEDADTITENTIIEGNLPDEVFAKVKGHYEDNADNTVDVNSPALIVRYIKGGNESHKYDEKIRGYSEVPEGYIIYVEWDEYKYTYLYEEKDNNTYLFFSFEDGWEPHIEQFGTNGIQDYKKVTLGPSSDVSKSTGVTESPAKSEMQNDDQYYTQGCRLVKQGSDYYLYPIYSGESMIKVKTYEYKSFGNGKGYKIAADAIVGIAKSVEFTETIYGTEFPTFQYEYANFYDVADDLITSQHWQNIDMGYGPDTLAFEVDGMVVMDLLLINFNDSDEIVQLMDFYSE